MRCDYDMMVIGGGAAGLTAAGMSAVLGARTALIESRQLGGDCTWHGCIPSKSLLHAAKIAHQMRTAARYGLTPAEGPHDFARVMDHIRAIRQQIYEDADAPRHFEKLGVEVVAGRARFLDPHTVEVGDAARRLTSTRFIIATGSSPRIPELPSDGSVPLVTNETLFELDRLPQALVIAGAGPIGIEMAQAFARLDSSVTVADRAARILPRDDAELAGLLLGHLRTEGIQFALGSAVARVAGGAVLLDNGESVAADALLVAAGRVPQVASLNLAAAGVVANEKGVVVNARCRTSARHIYACGDVAGRYQFTHMAEHGAKVAVTNALLRIPASLDERHITWSTFCDPELAHLGRNEDGLRSQGVRYDVYRFPFSRLDRAMTEGETTGLVKVMAGRWGRILGVDILGVHAGEMIAEYAAAMRCGMRLDQLSSTIHPYPTYALGNRRAADLFLTRRLTPGMVRWLQRLLRLRGDLRGVRALPEL